MVFATATLAAGINMPARSTIISSTSVRRGADAFATITHNELLQMAGRAGRRGYDDRGELPHLARLPAAAAGVVLAGGSAGVAP